MFPASNSAVRNCGICSLIPRSGGIYVLLVSLERPVTLKVSGGETVLEPGYYVYIGSGWGPGGLASRICRHLGCRPRRRLHWHIDRILEGGGRVVGLAFAVGMPRDAEPLTAAVYAFSRIAGPASNKPIGGTDDPTRLPHVARCTVGGGERCLDVFYAFSPYKTYVCTLARGAVWECCGI